MAFDSAMSVSMLARMVVSKSNRLTESAGYRICRASGERGELSTPRRARCRGNRGEKMGRAEAVRPRREGTGSRGRCLLSSSEKSQNLSPYVQVRTDPFTRGLVPRLILALFRIRLNVRNEHGFRCNVRRVGAQRIRQPRR